MGPYEPIKVLQWSEMVRLMLSSSDYEQFQGVGYSSNCFVPCKPTPEKKRKTHRRKTKHNDYIRKIQKFISTPSFTPYPPKRTIDKRVYDLERKVSHLEKLYRDIIGQVRGSLFSTKSGGVVKKYIGAQSSRELPESIGDAIGNRSVISDLKGEIAKENKKQPANKKATSESLKNEEPITEILRTRESHEALLRDFSHSTSNQIGNNYWVTTSGGYFMKLKKKEKGISKPTKSWKKSDGVVDKLFSNEVQEISNLKPNNELFSEDSNLTNNEMSKNFSVTAAKGYMKKFKDQIDCLVPKKISDDTVYEELFSDDSNWSNGKTDKNYIFTDRSGHAKEYQEEKKEINRSSLDSVAADTDLLNKKISVLKNVHKQQIRPDNKIPLHKRVSRSTKPLNSEKGFCKSFKINFIERSTSTEIKLVEKATATVDIINKQELLQINSQSYPSSPDISLKTEQETYETGVPRRNKPQRF